MHSFLLAASFRRSFLNACSHIAKRPGDLDRFRLYRALSRQLSHKSAFNLSCRSPFRRYALGWRIEPDMLRVVPLPHTA
jgi:hypothetical protein